jgi:hypothetical protein
MATVAAMTDDNLLDVTDKIRDGAVAHEDAYASA